MKPLVAIVGRPNVGKSTLFNRIVGGKKAIVWNEPGVTRDRNYADVQWDERPFTLVDTGGFEPVSKERIFVQMKEQCELAMDEADAILFVMDGREGVTPSDKEIADILRRRGKPVFFVVNKIDGPKHEDKVFEFYALGASPLYSISAEEGYGISELMDEVVRVLPAPEEVEDRGEMTRVAVVGRPNVGKSSLINRLLGYRRVIVDEAPGTTRDPIDTPFERDGRKYLLIDTAGIRRKSRISLQLEKYSILQVFRTIDRSDVVLLVLDSTEGVTDQDARIGGLVHERGKGCILIANKWDLVKKESYAPQTFKKRIYDGLKELSYAPVLLVSALTGQHVPKILDQVDRVVEEGKRRIPTSQINRYLEGWVEGAPPPLYKNRSVRLNYMTQVSVAPPTFLIYTNFPEGIPSSYERYLTNRIRETFGFEGVPIRLVFRRKRRKD